VISDLRFARMFAVGVNRDAGRSDAKYKSTFFAGEGASPKG